MRLTLRTNLAMRTLMVCASNPRRIVRKSEVSVLCNASENHLGQVVRLLALHGFVKTIRGRHGGIRLARSADRINVGAVFRTLEVNHPFAECFEDGKSTCPLIASCWLRPAMMEAVEAFYRSLDELYLADLVSSNSELKNILCLHTLSAECERISN